jgi:protein-disulfide isomerase
MANTDPHKNSPGRGGEKLWYLALAASLLLNAYFYFNKKDKGDQVLATAAGRTFRWKDVSDSGKMTFKALDRAYYLALKDEAELWAENFVLPEEARSRGVSVEELLNSEIASKASVTPEEVQNRYALSPAADQFPWPDVLKEIETDLSQQKYGLAKEEYLKALYAKHGVNFVLKPPASYDGQEPPARMPARFPAYAPAASSLSPSRGPENAPILVEVYSDFHCPFSKRFAGTFNELEKENPGKLRIVFHHFPLPIHPEAGLAHEASLCAQDQGKFWEFHDKLMASSEPQGRDALSAWAAEYGMDQAAFGQCLDSGKYRPLIQREIASAQALGVRSTPTSFFNGRKFEGAFPLEMMKPIVAWYLKPEGRYPGPSQQDGQGQGEAPPQPSGPQIDPSKHYEFPDEWLKKGPSRGPDNAPVTIVEFVDYNCPFCQRGATTLDEVVASYPGKIRVIAKNLPLPMHPNAAKTAEAALCAGEQGKFWEFRSAIFGEFWGKQSIEDMKAIAKKIRLDEAKFLACFDQSRMKAAVDEDVQVIGGMGMTGTPTFFVNGTPLIGAQPAENFKKLIEEKLSGK